MRLHNCMWLSRLAVVAAIAVGGCSRGRPATVSTVDALRSAPPSLRAEYVEVEPGVSLYVQTMGQGRDTLVVLHGGPALDAEYLIPDLLPLARHATLVFYDQRGGGRSTLGPTDATERAWYGIDRHAADLDSLRVRLGMTRLLLVGNSWGAMLAARYTERHPERVRGLVLHAPGYVSQVAMAQGGAGFLARIGADGRRRLDSLRVLRNRATLSTVRELCREETDLMAPVYFSPASSLGVYHGRDCVAPEAALLDEHRARRLAFASLGRFDFRQAAANYSGPVLVVVGSDDWVGMDNARAWASAYPRAQLVEIAAAGHFVHAEQPGVYTDSVLAFLRRSAR